MDRTCKVPERSWRSRKDWTSLCGYIPEEAAVYMKEEHIDSQVISDIAEFVHGVGK